MMQHLNNDQKTKNSTTKKAFTTRIKVSS